MTTQAELNAELELVINQCNQILLGGETATVTINGTVKPTITKDIKDKFDALVAVVNSSGTTLIPLEWNGTGNGSTTSFAMANAPSDVEAYYFVEVGGVLQYPSEYTVNSTADTIVFDDAPANGVSWSVRTFAVSVAAFAGVEQERIVATAGQTVFNLSTITFTPGTSGISVYRNGSFVTNFVETDSNTLTFDTAANDGDEFDFIVNQRAVTADTVLASSVTYTPPGASTTNVNTYLNRRKDLSVKDFGAVGDGTGNDAPAVQALIYYARFNGGTTTDERTLVDVHIDAGRYRCTSKIYVPGNTRIIGRNGVSPRLQFIGTSGFCGANGTHGDTGQSWYTGTGDQHIQIENIWLEGNDTAGTIGMDFDETFFFTAKNCVVGKFDVCYDIRSQVASIEHSRATGYRSIGYKLSGQSNTAIDCNAEQPLAFSGTIGFDVHDYACCLINPHIEGTQYAVKIRTTAFCEISSLRVTNAIPDAATAYGIDMEANASCIAKNISGFATTNLIRCTDSTQMSVTAINYVPLWAYANNTIDGEYTHKFKGLSIVGSSSATQTFTTSAGVLGTILVDNTNGRLKIRGLNGVRLADTGDLTVGNGLAQVFSGTGSPQSVVTATVGALYLRVDGGAGTCLYIKESGTGSTGWVAK